MANLRRRAKFRANRSNRCKNVVIFWFFKWRPSAILDMFYAILDHPRWAFGGLCHYAKFGWIQCSSFDASPNNVYSIGPKCSRFHQNRFTFGGVIAERVNTAKTRRKVNPIFGWCLASSRIIKQLTRMFLSRSILTRLRITDRQHGGCSGCNSPHPATRMIGCANSHLLVFSQSQTPLQLAITLPRRGACRWSLSIRSHYNVLCRCIVGRLLLVHQHARLHAVVSFWSQAQILVQPSSFRFFSKFHSLSLGMDIMVFA